MTSKIIDKPRVGRSCPSIITLDAILNGDTLDVPVLEHIESCSSCAQRLDEMRMTNLFLTRAARDLKEAPRNSVPVSMPESTEELLFTRNIGYGSQGEVYEAVQVGTQRNVAVKVLKQGVMNSENSLARFQREIKLAASLDHPNIVTLHTAVDLPGDRHAYVMQFVVGETMDRWQARVMEAEGASNGYVDVALCVFEKILRAAAYAHSKGVIHRDLKPKNVLVDAHHEPHILDFGIACLTDDVTLARRSHTSQPDGWETQTNEFVGSPHYAAPEQLVPGLRVDERTDVYAVGVMLRDALQKSTARLALESRRVTQEDLRWVLSRALASDPAERYSTATAFADDLVRLREHRPVKAHPKSTRYVLHRLIQRRPAAVLMGAGIVLLIVLSMVVVFNQSNLISARNTALHRAGYLASIDHAGSLLESGSYLDAEQLLWDALLTGPTESKVDEVDTQGPSLTSPALWGLRSLYARQPCLSTFHTALQNIKTYDQLMFDDSGELLFLLHTNGVLETWDWQHASLRGSVQLTPGPILSMAASNSSSYVAVITQAKPEQVFLYDMMGGKAVERFDCSELYTSGSDGLMPKIAVSPGTKRLAIAAGRSFLLVELSSGEAMTIEAALPDEQIVSLDFSEDSTELLVVYSDGMYELRDATTGQITGPGAYPANGTRAGIIREGWYLPGDGRVMLAGDTQYAYDIGTGEYQPMSWHSQSYSVRGVDLPGGLVATSFGAVIVAGHVSGSDVSTLMLRGHRGVIRALSLHGGKQLLASLDSKEAIRVWDLRESARSRTIQTPSATIFSVETILEGEFVLSGGSSGELRAWSWREGTAVEGLQAKLGGMISRIAVSPDERLVAVGGDNSDPRLLLISNPSGERLLDLGSLRSRVTGLVFSPDGQMLAAAASHDIVVIDLPIGSEPRVRRTRVDEMIRGLDFSSDSQTLFCTSAEGVMSINPGTLQREGVSVVPESVPRHIAASPAGEYFVIDGNDSVLRMYDQGTGGLLRELIGHSMSDHWMDFDSSGDLLLSAGEDSVLKIWDPRTGRCLATFEGYGESVFCVRFVPGTLRAVTGDTRGRIGLWDFGGFDRYVAGNLEAAISRAGEGNLLPARTGQLRRWAQNVLAAQ